MAVHLAIYGYIWPYMDQVPSSDGYPPPGEGYPWGMDSFLKLMISTRNPCYGAPPERDSPLEEPWMVDSSLKAHFPQGVRMPHTVLDENIVKTIGIYVFCVTLFETYDHVWLYMAIYDHIRPKICILVVWTCIWAVWTCILDVWTCILCVWACMLGVWSCFGVSGLVFGRLDLHFCVWACSLFTVYM